MQAHLTLLPLFLALLLNLQPTSSEPCTSSFTSSLLSRTNYHRKFHHSPPLALNASLSARAQAWADQLLASGSQAARHRPNRRLSENLFLKITDSGVQLSAEVVVDSWYAGSQLYGQFYGSEPNLADFSSWRYFTAMIWAASRQVGIGCSTEILLDSGKRITYVVANFSPRGNVVGGFKENVRRPKRKVETYQTTSSYNRTSTAKTSTNKAASYSSTITKATTSRKPYKKPASTRPTSTTTTTTAKPSPTTTTTTTKKYPQTATTKSTTARTTRKAPASYSTTKSKTNKPTTAKPATTKAYPKTTRKPTSATKYTSATKRTTTTTKAPPASTSTTTPPAPTFYQPSPYNQNIPYSNPNLYHHHRPQYYRPRPRPPPPPPSSSIFSHEDLLDLHEAANHKWPPSRPKPVFYLPPGYQNSKQPLPARPSSFPFKPLPLSSFLSPNLPNFHHYPPSPHQKHVFRPSFYRPVYKPVKFYKNTQNNPVVNDYNNNNSVRRSSKTKQLKA